MRAVQVVLFMLYISVSFLLITIHSVSAVNNGRELFELGSGEEQQCPTAEEIADIIQECNIHICDDDSDDNDDEDDEDDEDDDDEDDKGYGALPMGPNRDMLKLTDYEWLVTTGRTKEQREHLRTCVRWATGLEHESMLIHRKLDGLEEYVVDANKVLREMSRYGSIYGLSPEIHNMAVAAFDAGVEFSGRRCAGQNDVSLKVMLEAISQDPLELTFDAAWEQMDRIDHAFLEMATKHPFTQKAIKENGFGPVTRPRTGMSDQLGMYQRTGGKWYSCASCGTCQLKDYTGSYHMSLSLPHTPDGHVARDPSILVDRNTCAPPKAQSQTSKASNLRQPNTMDVVNDEEEQARIKDEWIEAHMNLSNMIQWIEPLLVAVFGTGDSASVCDVGDKKYTEGSFRSMNTGWGVPGTTDVRSFKSTGIGRYVKDNFDWLFPDSPELVPTAYRETLSGCIESGMGADIRTKSSVDEHYLRPDESLPVMEVGRGIEIRIFDNFPIEDMPQAYRFVTLIAEAGRTYTAPEYITDSDTWHDTMQRISKEGWNTLLPDEYVTALVTALNLPPSFTQKLGTNRQAFTIYKTLYKTLWELHSDGFWTGLLLDDIPDELPSFAVPNRDSWEIGAINKGITPERVAKLLGFNGKYRQVIKMSDLKVVELDGDGLSCDEEDFEDLVYLAEKYGMISKLTLRKDGNVDSFVVNQSSFSWDENYMSAPVCHSAP